jgi:hypothetical protein
MIPLIKRLTVNNQCNYFSAMANAGSKAKGGDKAPVIVDHLKSDFVKDGESVILSCRIIGM